MHQCPEALQEELREKITQYVTPVVGDETRLSGHTLTLRA